LREEKFLKIGRDAPRTKATFIIIFNINNSRRKKIEGENFTDFRV